ncbi:MAG TPA: anticodon nuclease [Flavobacteriaceae bacterium]|nr:anticodon nuclease [Flavobacteriaceae bacterium]
MRSKTMSEFDSVEDVADKIKENLNSNSNSNKKKISVIYAFNGTGKTRLSNEFIKLDEENELTNNKVLCYNAFLEDLFKWDNEQCILFFDSNSWESKLIGDEGLESKIIDNFQTILNTKIEPSFNLKTGEITFYFPSDNDRTNIKISSGEESMFIWSVFYTILETAIDELNISEESYRSTNLFNELEYVIIDDPVSSIDDTKLITQAIELIKLIKLDGKNSLKFLVTTHHALFYNIFFNSFGRDGKFKSYPYILSKKETKLKLEKQKNDSPFGYHLLIKDEIKKAIDSGNIQKYHFNLFRSLLEKTANFLGYNNWYDCITGDKKQEITKIVNLYSHSKLVEMEYKELSDESKDLFKTTFNNFIRDYNWKV